MFQCLALFYLIVSAFCSEQTPSDTVIEPSARLYWSSITFEIPRSGISYDHYDYCAFFSSFYCLHAFEATVGERVFLSGYDYKEVAAATDRHLSNFELLAVSSWLYA